jgi:tRNA nucleotidyltransferase (CCA-adding enzyme)
MTVTSVISKALQYCQPSPREIKKLTAIANETTKLVSNYSSPKISEVVLGGSFAKGTWLKDDVDLDLFVKIDPSISKDEFEQIGKEIGLQSLKRYRARLRYSNHPYVEAIVKGVRVNVVPCYNVESGKWKSAADRSPFHTEYIKNNLDNEKKQQVRLLKKFLKSIGIYGAEIAKNGFSGYIAEVLILKYGSFMSALYAIANIVKENNIISIVEVDKDIIKTFQSHIVIIDPVDPRRNLGTAVSGESLGKFILAARTFLERPSLDFFTGIEKKYTKYNAKLYSNILIIEFRYKQRSPDVIWGQLKKTLNAISKQLSLACFTVMRSICITDEKGSAAFVFLLQSITIPLYVEKTGPEVFRKRESASFISKNIKGSLFIWINREMRVTGLFQRSITNAKDYAHVLLFKRIDVIGVTKGLIDDIHSGTLQIYTGDEKRKIKGIVRSAVNEIVSTERYIVQ